MQFKASLWPSFTDNLFEWDILFKSTNRIMVCFGDFHRFALDALSTRLAGYLPKERNQLEKSFPDSGYGVAPLSDFRRICAVFSNNLNAVH